MDELVEAAKKNHDRLFVMGLDQEELGHQQWIREIEGSGPVEVLLLACHPHFENVKGTRTYMLRDTNAI